MGKKKYSCGLGKAINNAQKKASETNAAFHFHGKRTFLEGQEHGVSCLESSNLDDFLAKAELANAEFEAIRGRFSLVDKNVVAQREKQLGMDRKLAEIQGVIIPIPRRPMWFDMETEVGQAIVDGEQLQKKENESFLQWRKKLAQLEEDFGFVMTPFERNLDFWRQLWRVCEKSDLVCTICDCRDPLFYRSLDLENYVKELGGGEPNVVQPARRGGPASTSAADACSDDEEQEASDYSSVAEDDEGSSCAKTSEMTDKGDLAPVLENEEQDELAAMNAQMLSSVAFAATASAMQAKTDARMKRTPKKTLLILNKADYMPANLRQQWREYFARQNVTVAFFSAKYELAKLGIDLDLPTEVIAQKEADDQHEATTGSTADQDHGTSKISVAEHAEQNGAASKKSRRRAHKEPAFVTAASAHHGAGNVMSQKSKKPPTTNAAVVAEKMELEMEKTRRMRKGPKNTPAAMAMPAADYIKVCTSVQQKPKSVFLSLESLSTEDEEETSETEDHDETEGKDNGAGSTSVRTSNKTSGGTGTPDQQNIACDPRGGTFTEVEQVVESRESGLTHFHTMPVAQPAEQQEAAQPRPAEHQIESSDVDHNSGDGTDILDCEGLMRFLVSQLPPETQAAKPVVGFCGYPNVGKSSIINALFGTKKVSMSRQPGKTKHFQTLEGEQFTLCDCPGLVFPSIVATKAHLVINSVMPIDQLRSEYLKPIELIVEKVGTRKLYEMYKCAPLKIPGTAQSESMRFLASFATARKHFLRDLVPDTTWAAQRLLKDFTTGVLLHCEPPPGGAASISSALEGGAAGGEQQGHFEGETTTDEEPAERNAEKRNKVETLLPPDSEEEEDETHDAQQELACIAEEESAVEQGTVSRNRENYAQNDTPSHNVAAYDAWEDWNPASLAEMLGHRPAPPRTKRQQRRDAKMSQKSGQKKRNEVFGITAEY
ncbi:unnamed protein product [Amoebophrya sp. A120]|nr:unnamed protein product [Amoebophrya sp. A120]|eukprot:GSA120T00017402001.1